MEMPRVFMVHLRRPRNHPDEMRSDPFWEFGSFGCTGCHSKNLLNKMNAPGLKGARLAFAQGGSEGFRLVFLTPPVRIRPIGDIFEVRWSPADMPFRYSAAPLLIANDGRSDMATLKEMIAPARRSTWEARFSSCFRSRATPLREEIADQIATVYDTARLAATAAELAGCYSEALPYRPPKTDAHRRKTYQELLHRLQPPRVCGQNHKARRC